MKRLLFISLLLIFIVGCEKDVYVTPPLNPPENGYAFITSIPQGATIFLNGKNTGKVTPDSLVFIEYGSSVIKLRKEGFYDSSFTVEFAKDVKNYINIDFTKNPRMKGSISFTSNPSGAAIFLNDSSISKVTPYTLTGIIPGEYNVKYKKLGYRDGTAKVKVSSGTNVSTYIMLQDTTKWVDFKVINSGITSDFVTALEIDDNNKIWIGTDGNGLSVFNGINWINYNKTNTILTSDKITVIKKDNLGNIWIGTESGLAKYYNGAWEIFTTLNSNIPNNYITSIAIYSNEVWIGTKSGLVKYSNNTFDVFNTNNSGLPDNWITALGFGFNNKLYIGTYYNGIVEKDGNNYTILAKPNFVMPGNSITAINYNRSDKLWVGHLPTSSDVGGLSYYNGTKFTAVTGLSVNKINYIFTDNKNLTWVSTDDGIVTIDQSLLKTFILVQNSGLTNNFVRTILQDKNGAVWIATYGGGICKFKKY